MRMIISSESKKTRIMAIDFGDARTGVAVSDISATLTGDAWVINEKRRDVLAGLILEEVKSRNIGVIVVGYPKNMDGSAGFRAEASEAFVEILRNLINIEADTQPDLNSVNIVFFDERLTTKMADQLLKTSVTNNASRAKRRKKRKSSVDAVAASLILEGYILNIKNSLCDTKENQ